MKAIFLILTGFFLITANAQQSIQGKVTDESGQPLTGVSVSLLRLPDSVLVKIVLTNNDGRFRFSITEVKTMIKLSATGFQSAIYPIHENKDSVVIAYVMKKEVKELANVQVKSIRPLYQFLPDKTILNIDAAPSNAGSNLLEVLNKIPDIYIDKDGNISLNGKPGVMVMIDGRETFLSGSDLVSMLRNMPAATADQVEIISNPPAKYDASTTGGILNIKSKKGLKEGLNGNVSSSTGIVIYNDVDNKNKFVPLHNSTLNWNYRKNKVNIYGNASYDHDFFFENFKTTRFFFTNSIADPAGSYFSWSHVKTPDNSYSLRLACDITLNKNNLFGFISNSTYYMNSTRGGTQSQVMDNNEKIVYLMRSTIENPGGNGFNGNYNINHKYTSTSKKTELTTDASFLAGNSRANTINETRFYDTLNNEIQLPLNRRQTARTRFVAFVIKSDLIVPDWLKAKWESGYKFTYIQTISNPLFLRKENNEFVVDNGRTNYFKYSENIHAAYITMSRTLKSTTLQAGLRMEHATGHGYQRINDSSFTRQWISLFPSFFLQQQVSPSYQVILNYSRKIRRPSAGNLNPFTYFTDSLYSNSGNPFIQPHFSHNFELKNIIKNKYSIRLAYTLVNNIITLVVNHDPVNKLTKVRVQNFDQFEVLSLSASAPFKLTSWWQINVSATAATNQAKGTAFGHPVKESSTYWSVNFANDFTLSPSLSADASLIYSSPQLSGLIVVTRPISYSFGIRKSLKNDNGSISFATDVPLYIPYYRFNASYATTVYRSRFSTVDQTYRLTFNLRFGKQTVTQHRNKKNATDEEQSRM